MDAIRVGPLLRLAKATPQVWTISVLILADDPPGPLDVVTASGQATVVASGIPTVKDRLAWRYVFDVALTGAEEDVTYGLAGTAPWRFKVPASGTLPRLAYASCNGVSDPRLTHDVSSLDAMWHVLMGRHEGTLPNDPDPPRPYHALLLGGDQIYADPLFDRSPFLEWQRFFNVGKFSQKFTIRMRDVAERYYLERYSEVFAQPEAGRAFAAMPSIAMWDDHDIFDGWGSYDDERQNCDVYQHIYPIARRFFRLFQLHLGEADRMESSVFPPRAHTNFSCAYDFGALALVVPDLRSERTPGQVMSLDSWDAVFAWMDARMRQPTANLKHLIFMSSIPLVYADGSSVEKILSAIPFHQGAEDDLRDQWTNHRHAGERTRLIRRLLDVAGAVRVTVLSGDVHVAARGTIESRRVGADWDARVIAQLISSAIAHPPPGMLQNRIVEAATTDPVEVDGILTRLETFALPDGSRRRIIPARNWLSLEPDEPGGQSRYWCNWYVESEDGLLPAAGTAARATFPRHDKLTHVLGG